MRERTEYAVVRFLDNNGYCHMVNDFVQGHSVMQYVKEEVPVSKQCVFQWMIQLAHQMEQFCKCGEENAYGYVNPYAVIIAEDREVLLLDTKDQDNEDIVNRMQKKKVRMLFVKKEHILSKKMLPEDDLYGYGKMVQFMSDKLCEDTKFTKKEERILKKIVDGCISGKKTGAQRWREIRKMLGSICMQADGETEKSSAEGRKWIFTGAVLLAAAAFAAVFIYQKREAGADYIDADMVQMKEGGESGEEYKSETGKSVPAEAPGSKERIGEELAEAKLELGIVYYVELENYTRGRICLEEAAEESALAEVYLGIIQYLQQESEEEYLIRELERMLETGIQELEKREKKTGRFETSVMYYIPFLRVYGMLGTEESWKEVKRIGEKLEGTFEDEQNKKQETELRKYLAKAYEILEEPENAVSEYEELLHSAEAEGKEEIYLKLETLYEKVKEYEKAWDICRKAVEDLPKSEKLWLVYIRRHCRDVNSDRAVCAEAVKKALQNQPALAENTEFRKLQEEYEITLEGDNVCVGK